VTSVFLFAPVFLCPADFLCRLQLTLQKVQRDCPPEPARRGVRNRKLKPEPVTAKDVSGLSDGSSNQLRLCVF